MRKPGPGSAADAVFAGRLEVAFRVPDADGKNISGVVL